MNTTQKRSSAEQTEQKTPTSMTAPEKVKYAEANCSKGPSTDSEEKSVEAQITEPADESSISDEEERSINESRQRMFLKKKIFKPAPRTRIKDQKEEKTVTSARGTKKRKGDDLMSDEKATEQTTEQKTVKPMEEEIAKDITDGTATGSADQTDEEVDRVLEEDLQVETPLDMLKALTPQTNPDMEKNSKKRRRNT